MSSNLTFRLAQNKQDYLLAWPLVRELNPELNEETYFLYLKEMQTLGTYWLVLAYKEETFVGICGYWIATKFYTGKYMEIDNFIIHEDFRGENFGTSFMNYLEQVAKDTKCETVMLDAYLENKRGHAFYERNGYLAKGYHFVKKID